MPKRRTMRRDDSEKRVIQALLETGERNIDRIAERCGFSRQKVWRIIKKLEANHTIWGYHPVVDQKKLHTKTFYMFIKKTNEPLDALIDIILTRDIEKNAEKIGIYIQTSIYLHGHFDWMVVFTAEDIKHAKKFCSLFHRVYQNYVRECYLVEEIFPVKVCGIQNPEIQLLNEFRY
ncbi:MAG: Lrp/AsnC family transcriptional regulator [Candidatus Thermoplasmatota archaeon]|nr:Lrp/AsnC family transcriptional regulator [Candidatus Thermoplasmatota archaeon]